MRLSSKLLGFLNRAFSKDADAFLALRLRYDGGPMRWTVRDGYLLTDVAGGPGGNLSIDLSLHTVRSLAGVLSLAPGYVVPFVAGADQYDASALRLLDGTGDQDDSNGDHLTAYSSILYSWLDMLAVELDMAERAIVAMPAEMNTRTADGEWLDYQGSLYAVPRFPGEPDRLYGARIITEVLRPLSNNVAIEAAIAAYTGTDVRIVDVVIYRSPEPRFAGLAKFDGLYKFNPSAAAVYGLFDGVVGYNLLDGDVPTAFVASVRAIIERVRAAGTQLRGLTLAGSVLTDTADLPTDDDDTMTVTHGRFFNGSFNFDGWATFGGSVQEVGHIAGADSIVPVSHTLPLRVLVAGLPVGVRVTGRDRISYGVVVQFTPPAP